MTEIDTTSTALLIIITETSTDNNLVRDACDVLNYRGFHLSAEGWYHRPGKGQR